VEERVTPLLARDEHVGTSIGIEIAEDRVTRAAHTRETKACRRIGERAIEIVAIHRESILSDEKKIEISIVIEVDEERFARSFGVRHPGFRCRLCERTLAVIAKEMSTSITIDDKKIQPAI